MSLSLAEIVAHLGGELRGDGSLRVSRVGTLEGAGPGEIGFLSNPKYRDQLAATRATAVILAPEAAAGAPTAAIVTPQPYLYFARVSALLHPPLRPPPGLHPSAVVEGEVAATASIGAHVFVGAGTRIGENAVVEANCTIGPDCRVGADSWLHAGVTLYRNCRLGARCIVHSGAVLGADGFGFAPEADGRWLKIPQVGGVLVGDDVEIGANTSIDRGAIEDTVIDDGVKLDNQIQVAHNVRIGAHTAIAGCVGIAGSTRIGRGCTIGGAAMIIGHLDIADGVHVSAGTFVGKSIPRPGHYSGSVPLQAHSDWLRNFSRLRHLEAMADKIRALEMRLAELENKQ